MIDSHCHLASERFAGDVDDVIARAQAAGVTRIIVPATDLADAPRALALAEKYESVWVAVGIHPCDVALVAEDSWLEQVAAWSEHEKVVAIGECGLDYFHAPPEGMDWASYKSLQAKFFRAQLALAEARRLPGVVHHRGDGCWAVTAFLSPESSPTKMPERPRPAHATPGRDRFCWKQTRRFWPPFRIVDRAANPPTWPRLPRSWPPPAACRSKN